jgi:DNA-binding cell septation regulator SpoVG
MSTKNISEINFKLVNGKGSPIVAIASLIYDHNLYLGSIALRQESNGIIKCLFPTKKIGNQQFSIYNPINKETQEAISKSIIQEFQNFMRLVANDSRTA